MDNEDKGIPPLPERARCALRSLAEGSDVIGALWGAGVTVEELLRACGCEAEPALSHEERRWRFLEHGCQWVSWIAHGKDQVSFDPRNVEGMGGLLAMRKLIDEQAEEQIAYLRAEAERLKGKLK